MLKATLTHLPRWPHWNYTNTTDSGMFKPVVLRRSLVPKGATRYNLIYTDLPLVSNADPKIPFKDFLL